MRGQLPRGLSCFCYRSLLPHRPLSLTRARVGAQWPPLNLSRRRTRRADNESGGFRTILIYCVGPSDRDSRPRCWHYSVVPLDRRSDWDWYDTLAYFTRTQCGSVGWVDPRSNWSEVINYSKGVS
jgi:hypothetical protein